MSDLATNLLENYRKQFAYYRRLGERTLAQLSFEEIRRDDAARSNSVAVIVKHLTGNLRSRWTDFLTSDGEKPWRNRESEFVDDYADLPALRTDWDDAWAILERTLADLTPEQLTAIVYIRNEGHTVAEAMNRQLAHYAYHVGQMVLLGKQRRGTDWRSLSIPRGKSAAYNADKFAGPRVRRNFLDGLPDDA